MANLSIGEAAHEIHALINESPRTPLPDQIAAIIARCQNTSAPIENGGETEAARGCPELHAQLREREEKLCNEYGHTDEEALVPQIHVATEELERLTLELPFPPRTSDDLRVYAELAFHGANKHPKTGNMTALDDGDCFEKPAARLIQAVLTMGAVPRQAAETPLLAKVRVALAAAADAHAVEAALPDNEDGNRDDHPARLAFNRHIDAILAIEREVPTPATQPDQQLALALLANFHMHYFPEVAVGQTEDLWDDNAEQRCALRLLRGFLLAHGERPTAVPST